MRYYRIRNVTKNVRSKNVYRNHLYDKISTFLFYFILFCFILFYLLSKQPLNVQVIYTIYIK